MAFFRLLSRQISDKLSWLLVMEAPEGALVRWINVTPHQFMREMLCCTLKRQQSVKRDAVRLIYININNNISQTAICIIIIIIISLTVICVSAGNVVLENLKVKENALVSLRPCPAL